MTPDHLGHPIDSIWVRSCETYRKSIVRISCGNSSGTGWIAAIGQEAFLMVTALHVIAPAIGPDKTPFQVFHEDLAAPILYDPWTTYPCGSMVCNPVLDLATVPILHPPPGPGLQLLHRIHAEPPKRWVPLIPLGIAVGWIGFPETSARVFGQHTVAFCQGHVSSKGMINGVDCYLLDGMVNRGMSGAPIWDHQGSVLGMIRAFSAPPVETIPFPGYGLVLPIGNIMAVVDKVDGLGFYTSNNPNPLGTDPSAASEGTPS
jgi:hypothetical protein